LLIYINSKLDLFILTDLVYSAELLADFSYKNFTVSYRCIGQTPCSLEHYLVLLRNQWHC